MWTKRQICSEAFAELGLASYDFDLTPEEYQSALRRLDSLMAEMQQRGFSLGYALPSSPDDADLDQDSGLPDYAVSFAYLNLAVRLGPQFGKPVPQETKVAAEQAKRTVLMNFVMPPQQQYPASVPLGAGNKVWRGSQRRFIRPPDESPIRTGDNGNLDFLEG